MDLFHALLLGILQGITEFLPISSSAHLILVPALAGWADQGLRLIWRSTSARYWLFFSIFIAMSQRWHAIVSPQSKGVVLSVRGNWPHS